MAAHLNKGMVERPRLRGDRVNRRGRAEESERAQNRRLCVEEREQDRNRRMTVGEMEQANKNPRV